MEAPETSPKMAMWPCSGTSMGATNTCPPLAATASAVAAASSVRRVRGPHIGQASLVSILLHDAGDHLALLQGGDVAAVLLLVAGLEVPAEQFAIELLRCVRVGGHQINPARRAGRDIRGGHSQLLVSAAEHVRRSKECGDSSDPMPGL